MPNIKVFVERENTTKNMSAANIEELLRMLKINPEAILISKNNELVTKKAKLKDGDEIKLLSVISGG